MAEQTYQGQWRFCRWPDLGHHPGHRRDPDGNRATCTCGWAAPDPSPTLGDLIQAWADHAAHLGS